MRGWLGGSVPGLRSRLGAFIGAAALALPLACTGGSMLVGEERPIADPAGEGVARDGGVMTSSQPGVALLQDCPASPGERQALLGCWPPPHLGRYVGFFIGAPRYPTAGGMGEEFPTGDLLLELAIDGTGELSFGGVAAPGERESCADLGSTRCASIGRLLPGFGYRLEDLQLFDPRDDPAPPRIAGEPPRHIAETMSFAVRLGQPWEAWCAAQPAPKGKCPSSECADAAPDAPVQPVGGIGVGDEGSSGCRCGETGCRPDATSLGITLRMSEDGQALRGIYEPSDRSVGDARLEFTRAPEP